MDKQKKARKRTFTLVELLIVLLILGVLVGLAVPRYMDVQKSARLRSFAANTREIESALETYRLSNSTEGNKYPDNLSELQGNFTQQPINPYTGKSMLSDNPEESGIQYQSDGTSYSICIAQQDVDDVNNNGVVEEVLPLSTKTACIESSYVSEFNDTFDSEASLSNWVAGSIWPDPCEFFSADPLPTLDIDNGALRIDSSCAYGGPYAQSTIAIKTPNPKRFVIEGDVKTSSKEMYLGFVSSNGKQWFRFGFVTSSFCIYGNDIPIDPYYNCTDPLREIRFCDAWGCYGDELNYAMWVLGMGDLEVEWIHLKVEVNDNVITGYVGDMDTPLLTVTTNSVFMPGYVTAELFSHSSDSTTGWFDNIKVYPLN